MKNSSIVLFAVAALIGTSTGTPFFGDELWDNMAYASGSPVNLSELDAPSKGNTQKAEFAYEMAQLTAKIISAPTTNVESFKVDFAYATAQVTTKVMPMIAGTQRNEFVYQMAQVTTKIVNDPNLDIERAKAAFAYEMAQLTTKMITAGPTYVADTNQNVTLLRNNADIEPKTPVKVNNTVTEPKAVMNTAYISPETYTGLVSELVHVDDRSNHLDNKVKIDGEIRYHYALNNGSGALDKDSSGIRARLGFDTAINQEWRVYAILEGQKKVVNYNDDFKLSHLYVAGKLGDSTIMAGSFGYLMADGNIYDSGFKGVRADFGEKLKYTLSYGNTDDTKKTSIATARYIDFDYNLEAGVYHYQEDTAAGVQNTIWTLGGNYNFSNFGVGAMVLDSSRTDSKGNSTGYVLTLNYGDLKTWRPGTYGIFAKYYDQPQYTYIAHGMNGQASSGSMQGFKGYGAGINYTLQENLVAGIEYYRLKDKINGNKGDTWWSQITHYF